MTVYLRHPSSGIRKKVSSGFSWIVFLFGGILGIPLFIRGLVLWGVLLLVINLPVYFMDTDSQVFIIFGLLSFTLSLYLGFKVNEITAKDLLTKGYVFENPDEPEVKLLKKKWDIAQL